MKRRSPLSRRKKHHHDKKIKLDHGSRIQPPPLSCTHLGGGGEGLTRTEIGTHTRRESEKTSLGVELGACHSPPETPQGVTHPLLPRPRVLLPPPPGFNTIDSSPSCPCPLLWTPEKKRKKASTTAPIPRSSCMLPTVTFPHDATPTRRCGRPPTFLPLPPSSELRARPPKQMRQALSPLKNNKLRLERYNHNYFLNAP